MENKKKDEKVDNSIEIDFGQRSVGKQNNSKIVTIPPPAWNSCGRPTKFNITLVKQNGETYIKMTPFDNTTQIVEEIDPLSGPQRKRT